MLLIVNNVKFNEGISFYELNARFRYVYLLI